jgi:hypothetical protein
MSGPAEALAIIIIRIGGIEGRTGPITPATDGGRPPGLPPFGA